ncbi:MAG TPA: methyltransferase domain-containing protein [Verrucomicrobiae bacterium]
MSLPRHPADAALPDFDRQATDALLNCRRGDHVGVEAVEIPRYVHTLRLIGGLVPRPEKVCDIATFGSIDPAVEQLFGIKAITTTGFPDGKEEREIVFQDRTGTVAHRFVHDRFDIEAAFPYADDTFDLVLFTEVLEHITRDPMHTLAEINRITRPGGWLILSTPNCVSQRSVLNALRGTHPYLWSQYSRQGHRDRHNREYTPGEVEKLLKSGGYEILDLHCRDVFNTAVGWHRRAVKRLLTVMLVAFRRTIRGRAEAGWSGDLIFAVARKASPVTERFPGFLYY